MRVTERTTELEKANAELRESERQLRLLAEAIPQQVWRATPEGSIDYCNGRLLEYLGRAPEEIGEQGLVEAIHPDDRASFCLAWRDALSGGKPFAGEWRIRRCDAEYRSFFTRAVPLHGPDGRTLRWYGTSTDIEDYKRAEAELMRSQAHLAHLSRVLSMGELTSSIAHEINQPLTGIVTYGQACLEWLSGDPPNLDEARQAAERIVKDGDRAGAVLSRIRLLFKKELPARNPVNLNEVIQELIGFVADEAARCDISIHTSLAPGLPCLMGDRVQLQQVVLNLVMNSIDAMKEAAASRQLLVGTEPWGEGILVRVEDNGVGLSSETLEQAFAPFFTTKPDGIGMGLSISRSIIESHGGRLWAAARPGGGAVFQFTIPHIEAE
jgi:PAS domain S-box-containing protein